MERIFLTAPLSTKKKYDLPPPPTKTVKCGQYDDDDGTEITDLIITLQAFKVSNGLF